MFIKRKSTNLFKKSATIALKKQNGGKVSVKKEKVAEVKKEEEKQPKKVKVVTQKIEENNEIQ